jgi:hypothetical protein
MIEAMYLDGTESADEATRWVVALGGQAAYSEMVYENGGGILVGNQLARNGDYVVRGVDGTFTVHSKHDFESYYEEL